MELSSRHRHHPTTPIISRMLLSPMQRVVPRLRGTLNAVRTVSTLPSNPHIVRPSLPSCLTRSNSLVEDLPSRCFTSLLPPQLPRLGPPEPATGHWLLDQRPPDNTILHREPDLHQDPERGTGRARGAGQGPQGTGAGIRRPRRLKPRVRWSFLPAAEQEEEYEEAGRRWRRRRQWCRRGQRSRRSRRRWPGRLRASQRLAKPA